MDGMHRYNNQDHSVRCAANQKEKDHRLSAIALPNSGANDGIAFAPLRLSKAPC